MDKWYGQSYGENTEDGGVLKTLEYDKNSPVKIKNYLLFMGDCQKENYFKLKIKYFKLIIM